MEDIIILNEEGRSKETPSSQRHKNDILKGVKEFIESFSKIGVKDKIVFFRLLSTMLNAGMTLLKSIGVLEKQEKNKNFKKML